MHVMGANTKIEWADHTFNPWRGCAKVSKGCAHCYAERASRRNPAVLGTWGKEGVRVVAAESYWRQPFAWDREARQSGVRRRVFCGSMMDVFEDREELEPLRDRLFGTIVGTPHLDWLLLTKRPKKVVPYYRRLNERRRGYWHKHAGYLAEQAGITGAAWARVCQYYHNDQARSLGDTSLTLWRNDRGLPNVWLGTSVENSDYLWRIGYLLQCPAVVRFVSYEPALGPLDLRGRAIYDAAGSANRDMLGYPAIDWVIAGGESGPKARPAHPDWFRSIRDQCQAAGVAFFFKGWGEWVPTHVDLGPTIYLTSAGEEVEEGEYGYCDSAVMRRVGRKAAGRLLDGREWNEFPGAVEETRCLTPSPNS